VKKLLRELELAGFIKRTRQTNGNLLSKRWIRCIKYVVPDGLKFSLSARQTDSQSPENQSTIFTPVKSSVTPEKQEKSSFPHTQETPERIM